MSPLPTPYALLSTIRAGVSLLTFGEVLRQLAGRRPPTSSRPQIIERKQSVEAAIVSINPQR